MTDVTPSGPAPTVRMNRDTLYSAARHWDDRLRMARIRCKWGSREPLLGPHRYDARYSKGPHYQEI